MGASLAVAALAVIYIAVIAANWPFTQQAVIDALQERSLRTVTIGHFSRTYFPPGCTAEDIRFLHRKHKEKQPLITVGKLVLVTSYLQGLHITEKAFAGTRDGHARNGASHTAWAAESGDAFDLQQVGARDQNR